eukprot:4558121-Lingulodinium_polyedra.AAC.1
MTPGYTPDARTFAPVLITGLAWFSYTPKQPGLFATRRLAVTLSSNGAAAVSRRDQQCRRND